ncbi:MAG: universal stress protein [Caldilineaceae bacterium]
MFTHILAPLDRSELAECILPHAVAVAHAFDAKLTILHVAEPVEADGESAMVDPLHWEMQKTEAQAYLDEIATKLRTADVPVATHLLEGRAAESIINFVHQEEVDLILLSSHGQSGLSRWNVGSVAQKVIVEAPASFMLVRSYQTQDADLTEARYQRILAPLDGSQRSECILASVEGLAHYHKAQLLLAHVVRRPEIPRHIPLSAEETELYERTTALNRTVAAEYLKQLQERLPLKSETHLLDSDDVASALHELARQVNADLIVLGAHGYSGSTKWPYGSMTTSFITYGAQPLLIIQDLTQEEIEPTPAQQAAREIAGH